jgi:hypothetical protein
MPSARRFSLNGISVPMMPPAPVQPAPIAYLACAFRDEEEEKEEKRNRERDKYNEQTKQTMFCFENLKKQKQSRANEQNNLTKTGNETCAQCKRHKKPARSITRPAVHLRPLDQLQPHFGARLARFGAASEPRVAALRHRRVDEREVLPRAAVVARPRGYVCAGHRLCVCG